MAAPKLEVYEVVWLSFNADPEVKFPYVPAQRPGSELVAAFLSWLIDERIFGPVKAGSSGGGRYEGAFWKSDAERVLAWWKARGVEPEGFDRWQDE